MGAAGTQRPIADDLFTWPSDDPHLIGGRCDDCGVVTFPRQGGCPGCASERIGAIELSTRGTLWTFTTQEYEVKEPYRGIVPGEDFVPFGLGYVELPEGVMVESRLTEADPERLEIGMAMELVLIPAFADADGTEVLTFAFAPAAGAVTGVDVAIVGIGIHPFGRHEGRSGVDMGAFAVRAAMRDAGVEFKDLQFAFGGSLGALLGHDSAQPDTLVNELGLTGLQFMNVANGCATAGSALSLATTTVASGQFDLGLAVGFESTARGHFNADPSTAGIGPWYGEQGLMVTTQFFAMKINRYMHEFGISHSTLAKVAAKATRNGAMNPNAWRREAMTEEQILGSKMLNYPLRQFMFCSPDEGAAAVIVCRADQAHRYTDRPVFVRASTLRSRRFGSFEVFSPWLAGTRADSPTVDASTAAYAQAGVGPEDIDVAQIQDSESGAEVIHMAENGFCKDGEQEALIQAGETEIGGRMPINTDGGLLANGEPIGASGMRQIYETVLQLRGAAGERQVPGDPRVGYTQVYGAPGIGACTILTR